MSVHRDYALFPPPRIPAKIIFLIRDTPPPSPPFRLETGGPPFRRGSLATFLDCFPEETVPFWRAMVGPFSFFRILSDLSSAERIDFPPSPPPQIMVHLSNFCLSYNEPPPAFLALFHLSAQFPARILSSLMLEIYIPPLLVVASYDVPFP